MRALRVRIGRNLPRAQRYRSACMRVCACMANYSSRLCKSACRQAFPPTSANCIFACILGAKLINTLTDRYLHKCTLCIYKRIYICMHMHHLVHAYAYARMSVYASTTYIASCLSSSLAVRGGWFESSNGHTRVDK